MKLSSALLVLAATAPLAAQTTTPHTARPAGATSAKTSASRPAGGAACSKLPELSAKIPALAAGLPCAKPLYTISTVPAVKLEYVSPLEGAQLKDDLGIEASSFSLDYVDTRVGSGEVAGAHNWYTINYTGYLLDGTKFDSSLDHGEPITIPYGQHQVIPGWDTGFAGMRVGGRRRLFIPFQLAYGATAHGPIPAKSMLVFDVELMSISTTPPKPKTPPAPPAGSQPAPPAPGGVTAPPVTPPDPAKPAAVPPTTDPTKPAAVPPSTSVPKP